MLRWATPVAVVLFVALAWPNLSTTVDDAWISARYADHLAHGWGLTYSVDSPPVEGFTNLVWVVALAVGLGLGAPPNALLTFGGLFFGVLCLPLVARLTRALSDNPVAPAVATLFVALDLHLAIASTNGLETAMYGAAVLLGAHAVATRSRPWLAGLAAAVRPEGLWLALAAAVRANGWRDRCSAMSIPLLIGAWRAVSFGALVPNTFTAKSVDPLWSRWAETLRLQGPDLVWWALVTAVLLFRSLRAPSLDQSAVARVGLLLLASTWTVAEWMPAGRLYVPAGLIAAALVASSGGWARWTLLAPLVVLLSPLHGHLRAYDRGHSVVPDNDLSLAIRLVAAQLPPGRTLAVRDAGVAAYWWGAGNPVFEMHEDALTRSHPNGGPAQVLTYTPKRPDVIVTTHSDPAIVQSPYKNDRAVLTRAGRGYSLLGRVKQHARRYCDVYVRRGLGVEALPDELVVKQP